MKRLFLVLTAALLVVAALIPSPAIGGATCPSNAQLSCGRACDSAYTTCNSRCDHWTTWQVTEGCRMECDLDLTACYNNCAISGGCAPV